MHSQGSPIPSAPPQLDRQGGSATARGRRVDDGEVDLRRGAAGEVDQRQGAAGAARTGRGRRGGSASGSRRRGDEQAARRGDLGRRGEERAAFASAVGEATV